jgi:hypothetical protein
MAKYKCPTLGDCDKANAGDVFEIAPGEATTCPGCATQLELLPAAPAATGRPKGVMAAVAAVVVVMAAGGAYLALKRPADPVVAAAAPVADAAAPATAPVTPNGIAPSDAETRALQLESENGLVNGQAQQAEDSSGQAIANEMMKAAIAKMAQGKLDDADKELQAARERAPKQPLVYYNLAVLRLKQARTNEALAQFEAAFMAGFSNFKEMDADTDLDALRKDARFADLVKRYRPVGA